VDDAPLSPVPLEVAVGAAPPVRRSLLLNTFYAIGGTGFYSACQLGVLVLLAKFATPEIAGQYFFALAIATPVVLFCGLELRGAFVADVGNQFSFGTYRRLCELMMVPAAVVLLGFMLWEVARGSPASYLLILGGVFAAKIIWAIAEVGWGTYQRRERLNLLAGTVGLRALTLILPFAVLLPLFSWLCHGERLAPTRLADGTALAIVLHALGVLAVLLFFDGPRVANPQLWNLGVKRGDLGALFVQTFPLGVVALIINLCDTLPRIVIEAQPGGKAQLGYFGSLAYITLAGNLVIIQAAAAAANRFSQYYNTDVRAFLRLAGLLSAAAVGVGAVVLTVAWFFGGPILRVLYTPDFARYEGEFRIIVIAHCLALLTNVFGTATTQMRLFWVQVPVQIITLASTAVAAILLISGENLVRGAAYTILVRAAVQLVFYTACVGLGLALRGRILRERGVQ
jgi:O-antigen/teichoic acid export membrane protein